MNSKVALTWFAVLYSFNAAAAELSLFPPSDIASGAWGSIASPALNQLNVADGNATLYRGWFDNLSNGGDLLAHDISSTGAVTSSAAWSAKSLLAARGFSSRKVVMSNSDYGCSNAGATDLQKYICGDHTNEASQNGTDAYRDRSSMLGAIIHSNPIYVGAPLFSYNFDNYLTFRSNNQSRAGRIYAAANDGMLHSFDTSGNEVFGFIPDLISASLSDWAAAGNSSPYLVDGPLMSGDVYADFGSGPAWKTLLVGGLGAGGPGYYLLDVTTPALDTDTIATIAAINQWQFNPAGMGYSFGKALLARTNAAGKWALIAANGYAAGGKPTLYIREIQNLNAVIKDLQEDSDAVDNGLSAPAAIDINNDNKIDYLYAGDLNGNLYRFDVSSSTPTDVSDGWTRTKIFTATDGANPQPILAAPELSLTSDGKVMVYFGSGDPWGVSSATQHSFYALKDDLSGSTSYTRNDLQPRKLSLTSNINYLTVDQTASPNDVSVNWASLQGWYLDLGANEQILQSAILHDSRIQFMIHNLANGDNWLTHLEYLDGRLPNEVVFDINGDNLLTAVYDNIDYIDSSNTGALVTGLRLSAELTSGPALAKKGNGALTYLNLWDAGMAGSAGSTVTTTSYGNSSCSTMVISRIHVNDDKNNVTFTFTGHTSAGDIQASITVDPEQKDDNARSPGLGFYPASAGAGGGVNTTTGLHEDWFGLDLEVLADTVGSNDTRLKVTYNGPYRTNGFTLATSDNMYRLQDADGYSFKTCEYSGYDYATKSCSGSNSCTQNSNNIDFSSDKKSVSYSGTNWSDLNKSNSYTPSSSTTTTTGATTATAAGGTPDSQLQSGNDATTGRLRWRELLF